MSNHVRWEGKPSTPYSANSCLTSVHCAMSKSTDRIPPERLFVSDRGAAKYFHGRKNTLQKFANQIREANKKNGGTILLIQATPGAGKTALLAECRRLAEAERWKIARIKPSDLWDTNTLLLSLGRARKTRRKERGWSGHVEGAWICHGWGV